MASRVLGPDYDAEVFEIHHNKKVDAPSGTALMLGKAVAKARGESFDDGAVFARHGNTGERKGGTVGFASLRGGDIVGDHTVYFAGTGERIEITHRSTSRATYAQGAMRAARFVATAEAGPLRHGRRAGPSLDEGFRSHFCYNLRPMEKRDEPPGICALPFFAPSVFAVPLTGAVSVTEDPRRPGTCRRECFSWARHWIRRANHRRGGLQHRDDGLPGDPHRSLVRGPDRHAHLSAHRQHRRQPRGRRVARRAMPPASSSATFRSSLPTGATRKTSPHTCAATSSWRSPTSTRAASRASCARKGAQNGCIQSGAIDEKAALAAAKAAPSMAGQDLAKVVSIDKSYRLERQPLGARDWVQARWRRRNTTWSPTTTA